MGKKRKFHIFVIPSKFQSLNTSMMGVKKKSLLSSACMFLSSQLQITFLVFNEILVHDHF